MTRAMGVFVCGSNNKLEDALETIGNGVAWGINVPVVTRNMEISALPTWDVQKKHHGLSELRGPTKQWHKPELSHL